jgi:hypothetical protein
MPYDPRYNLESVAMSKDKGVVWSLIDPMTGEKITKAEGVADVSPWNSLKSPSRANVDEKIADKVEEGRKLLSAKDRAMYDALLQRNPEWDPETVLLHLHNRNNSWVNLREPEINIPTKEDHGNDF